MSYLCSVLFNYYTMISIKNITFGYDHSRKVLQDFSLEFEQGGVYGLLGKNGTGKSTLLYLMAGLLRPQKGEVCIDGVQSQLRTPQTLQDLFIVPEEFDLPRISLRQYVGTLKPFYPRFSDELLERCLTGFDMSMDVHLGALSMGQKKKVYMCVALATNTRYLLMDEPTNGLDILSKSQFRKVVISGMSEDKTIIISTHQVHDVEHMLDHVCIIDQNHVLLNEPLNEDDGPVDLEKLFIDVQTGNYVPTSKVETESGGKTPTQVTPLRCKAAGFLDVARWDLTTNRKFYLRQALLLSGLILVPIIYKYLMLLGKFHLFNAAGVGAMMAAEQDVIAASYYFSSIFCAFMLLMFCYMFHNLTTKQGRISELTLPAANSVRFLWHVACSLLGTIVVFYLSVMLADLVHVLLGWIMLGQTEFQSLTLATWRSVDVVSLVEFSKEINGDDSAWPSMITVYMLQAFGFCLSASFLSTFALGSAWKYRHTFGFVLLCHIAFWLLSIVLVAFTGPSVVEGVLGFFDTCNHVVIDLILVLCSAALLYFIWWLTYRFYCRAQVTTKRNP